MDKDFLMIVIFPRARVQCHGDASMTNGPTTFEEDGISSKPLKCLGGQRVHFTYPKITTINSVLSHQNSFLVVNMRSGAVLKYSTAVLQSSWVCKWHMTGTIWGPFSHTQLLWMLWIRLSWGILNGCRALLPLSANSAAFIDNAISFVITAVVA